MAGRLLASAVVVLAVGAALVEDTGPLPGRARAQHPAATAASPTMPIPPQASAAQPSAAGQGGVAAATHTTPARLVIVRAGSVDSASAGVVVRRTPRDNHAISLSALAAAIPPSWMTVAGDTARLTRPCCSPPVPCSTSKGCTHSAVGGRTGPSRDGVPRTPAAVRSSCGGHRHVDRPDLRATGRAGRGGPALHHGRRHGAGSTPPTHDQRPGHQTVRRQPRPARRSRSAAAAPAP